MLQFTALSRNVAEAQSNAFADSNRNAHELKYIGDVSQKFEYKVQKHTKHTLFRVFECLDAGVPHCVRNLVQEYSGFNCLGSNLVNKPLLVAVNMRLYNDYLNFELWSCQFCLTL